MPPFGQALSDQEVAAVVSYIRTPVLSNAVMWSISQLPRPASASEVSEGAYQFMIGIRPPARSDLSTVAPKALRVVWQAGWQDL